jgi:hypothetical protein
MAVARPTPEDAPVTTAIFDIDEFEILVPAEGDDGVAAVDVARGAGDFEKFFGDGLHLEAGSALLPNLDFVGAGERVDQGAFGAVDLADVGGFAPFTAAGGELARFEHAGCAVFEIGEDGDPIVEV